MKSMSTLAGFCVLALALAGCMSNVKPPRQDNPPPAEAYSRFGRIEVKPVVLAPEFRGQTANENSLQKINANFFKRLGSNPEKWNSRPDNGRKLVIEPVATDIRFINVGTRIFTGPFSGSSGVVITVKVTDATTGKLIDNPQFYQHSSAAAGFALGVADNMMLVRIADTLGDYLLRNYDAAVGGKTGATEESVTPDSTAAR